MPFQQYALLFAFRFTLQLIDYHRLAPLNPYTKLCPEVLAHIMGSPGRLHLSCQMLENLDKHAEISVLVKPNHSIYLAHCPPPVLRRGTSSTNSAFVNHPDSTIRNPSKYRCKLLCTLNLEVRERPDSAVKKPDGSRLPKAGVVSHVRVAYGS